MKKVLLTAVAVFGFAFANAQDSTMKVGAHLGLPTGDTKEVSNLNLGADFTYLWSVSKDFKAGFNTGVTAYLPKEQTISFGTISTTVKGDTAIFLPINAAAEYSFSENIFVGLDFGYAIGLAPSGVDGGLLYLPKVGYQTEKFDITLGYKGISRDGSAVNSINLGFAYKL
jgi:hypothetical protein